MTFLLIVSSVWMVLALAAIQENNKPQFNKFLGLTILGGAHVLGLSGVRMDSSARPSLARTGISFSNSLFATTFFILTGFHGMHVTGGVIYNTCVLAAVNRGRYQAKHVEIAGLYWHFVDLGVDIDLYICLSPVIQALGERDDIDRSLHMPNTSRFSTFSWCSPSSRSRSFTWACRKCCSSPCW